MAIFDGLRGGQYLGWAVQPSTGIDISADIRALKPTTVTSGSSSNTGIKDGDLVNGFAGDQATYNLKIQELDNNISIAESKYRKAISDYEWNGDDRHKQEAQDAMLQLNEYNNQKTKLITYKNTIPNRYEHALKHYENYDPNSLAFSADGSLYQNSIMRMSESFTNLDARTFNELNFLQTNGLNLSSEYAVGYKKGTDANGRINEILDDAKTNSYENIQYGDTGKYVNGQKMPGGIAPLTNRTIMNTFGTNKYTSNANNLRNFSNIMYNMLNDDEKKQMQTMTWNSIDKFLRASSINGGAYNTVQGFGDIEKMSLLNFDVSKKLNEEGEEVDRPIDEINSMVEEYKKAYGDKWNVAYDEKSKNVVVAYNWSDAIKNAITDINGNQVLDKNKIISSSELEAMASIYATNLAKEREGGFKIKNQELNVNRYLFNMPEGEGGGIDYELESKRAIGEINSAVISLASGDPTLTKPLDMEYYYQNTDGTTGSKKVTTIAATYRPDVLGTNITAIPTNNIVIQGAGGATSIKRGNNYHLKEVSGTMVYMRPALTYSTATTKINNSSRNLDRKLQAMGLIGVNQQVASDDGKSLKRYINSDKIINSTIRGFSKVNNGQFVPNAILDLAYGNNDREFERALTDSEEDIALMNTEANRIQNIDAEELIKIWTDNIDINTIDNGGDLEMQFSNAFNEIRAIMAKKEMNNQTSGIWSTGQDNDKSLAELLFIEMYNQINFFVSKNNKARASIISNGNSVNFDNETFSGGQYFDIGWEREGWENSDENNYTPFLESELELDVSNMNIAIDNLSFNINVPITGIDGIPNKWKGIFSGTTSLKYIMERGGISIDDLANKLNEEKNKYSGRQLTGIETIEAIRSLLTSKLGIPLENMSHVYQNAGPMLVKTKAYVGVSQSDVMSIDSKETNQNYRQVEKHLKK